MGKKKRKNRPKTPGTVRERCPTLYIAVHGRSETNCTCFNRSWLRRVVADCAAKYRQCSVSDTRANSIAPSRQFVLSECDIGLRRRNFFLSGVIAGNGRLGRIVRSPGHRMRDVMSSNTAAHMATSAGLSGALTIQ